MGWGDGPSRAGEGEMLGLDGAQLLPAEGEARLLTAFTKISLWNMKVIASGSWGAMGWLEEPR